MIEFGKTLREAREAKGFSTRDIAEKTHMITQMVEDFENENFTKIAAPIYGRGFIKRYCEAVAINPEPLIKEFMDIYNGNREPTIRMRETVATPIATSPIATEEVAIKPVATPPAPIATDLFVQPPPAPTPIIATRESETIASAESVAPVANREEIATPKISPVATTEPVAKSEEHRRFVSQGPARFAAPTPIDNEKEKKKINFTIPPSLLRLLSLAGAAILILWLIIIATSALYNATMTPSSSASKTEVATEEVATQELSARDKQKTNVATPGEPRKIMKLPALYID